MLRDLEKKDAGLMLEWMHDPDVTEWMNANFAEKTIEDCEKFIAASTADRTQIHKAVVDDSDQYMGTVSLKNVNYEEGHGEFAITIRKSAMGKGYAITGMREIIDYGLKELGLRQVYWYVNRNNGRAVHFYDKNGFPRVDVIPEVPSDPDKYLFYAVENTGRA